MAALLHRVGLCQKARWGYRCHGTLGECSAASPDIIEANMRQAEVDAFADWLTEHGEMFYMEYYHQRSRELDASRQPKP